MPLDVNSISPHSSLVFGATFTYKQTVLIVILIIFVVSLVLRAVSKGFYSVAMLLVGDVHAFVFCTISQVYDGVSVHFIVDQLAITPNTIKSAMIVVVLSKSLHLVVAKLANVNVAVRIVKLSVSMCTSI